jgi:hypothetical protein
LKRASSRFASNGGGSRRGSANDAGGGAGDMAAIANRQHETWILLELCNGGSLQVTAKGSQYVEEILQYLS